MNYAFISNGYLLYTDIDDILVVFLLLKFDLSVSCSEGTCTFLSFLCEDFDIAMVAEIKFYFFIIIEGEFDFSDRK